MQELIYSLKKKKKKKNYSIFYQRRNIEIYKLLYMEDFEANVQVSEDKICASSNIHNESHSLPQGFFHADLYDTASV